MTYIEFAEKVLGIELFDWQKTVLEAAQKCKDDGKNFYIHTYARQGKILLNNCIQQKLGYDRGFEDGRTYEQLQSIEDTKTQATEYLDALDKAKEEAYQKGAREFAEWLNRVNYFDGWYKFDGNEEVKLTTDEILAEWQKGADND